MRSTTRNKENKINYIEKAAAIAAALLIWQIVAVCLDQKILLVTPFDAITTLLRLAAEAGFWKTVWFSFSHIAAGFLLGLLLGSFFALLSARFHLIETMLWPFMAVIKATPVASFIILCLVWLSSKNISVFICFLMVLPVIYTNLLNGMKHMDAQMEEMARLYRLTFGKRLRGVYLPQLAPYLLSAFEIAIGMAWKAGIAAEVIGTPAGSIGKMLYNAKIYLSTAELFAWTIVVVVISVVFEKTAVGMLKFLFGRLEPAARKQGKEQSEDGETRQVAGAEKARAEDGETKREKIELAHVLFSYADKNIFRDLSMRIPEGEITCLMGASGCGKTTLLGLLTGRLSAQSGEIRQTDGRRFGMVFQENRLCNGFTALGNLRLTSGADVSEEEMLRHLEAVGLSDSAHKKVSEFSGGMKRRLAIVRAILSDSDLLIFDEPFQGLDEGMRGQVISYIRANRNGRTLLVVTHEKEDVSAFEGNLILLEAKVP